MSILSVANGVPPEAKEASIPVAEKPKRPKRKGKNFAQIHAKPVPLEVHPLPVFHPSDPISLLRLIYTWLSDVLFPPIPHSEQTHIGYFSPETRSVHVTAPQCARVLWQMGFFGKGTLSRSEPSWLEREKARLLQEGNGRLAAEDWTNARREERRLFKLERARLEREKIDLQRLSEEGKLDLEDVTEDETDLKPSLEETSTNVKPDVDTGNAIADDLSSLDAPSVTLPDGGINGHPISPKIITDRNISMPTDLPSPLSTRHIVNDLPQAAPTEHGEERGRQLHDQEHLQLTLEEAFFLSYALGVLSVHPAKRRDPSPLSTKTKAQPYATTDLLELFCQYSSFPPADAVWITPDDQFLLNYVAYHHFRSLGWVVRPGQKFAVDYLLYNRGPVFSHAEFAVVVVPAYTDRYWNTPGGRARRRVWEEKDWWWLHCVNRVQSRVFKTLVLCYIDIPSELDMDFDEGIDIGKLLRSYTVREFVVRRWLPNRSRD